MLGLNLFVLGMIMLGMNRSNCVVNWFSITWDLLSLGIAVTGGLTVLSSFKRQPLSQATSASKERLMPAGEDTLIDPKALVGHDATRRHWEEFAKKYFADDVRAGFNDTQGL
jgi:hypothetical protein